MSHSPLKKKIQKIRHRQQWGCRVLSDGVEGTGKNSESSNQNKATAGPLKMHPAWEAQLVFRHLRVVSGFGSHQNKNARQLPPARGGRDDAGHWTRPRGTAAAAAGQAACSPWPTEARSSPPEPPAARPVCAVMAGAAPVTVRAAPARPPSARPSGPRWPRASLSYRPSTRRRPPRTPIAASQPPKP